MKILNRQLAKQARGGTHSRSPDLPERAQAQVPSELSVIPSSVGELTR